MTPTRQTEPDLTKCAISSSFLPSSIATPSSVPYPMSDPAPAPAPDSIDSSPRSRIADNWDDPSASLNSRLRLMCSYGGHIIPRPHHKSLCYVGGDTRLLVVDRHTSLADLSARLSRTLLGNRPFSLKYQIPHEDLDSLISVSTDEDLENMIDEYDRTASNPSAKPSRLRLFLFPWKPESSQSIAPILESCNKTEDWFLDALNGTGLLSRGFSDSASVDCLLGLEDEVAVSNLDSGAREVDASQTSSFENGKSLKPGQDIQSVSDSPMLHTVSSFGSTSSLPALGTLTRIRVHVDDVASSDVGIRVPDQKVLIEDQFTQINIGSTGIRQDEGFMIVSSPPPMPPATLVAAAVAQLPTPPPPQPLPAMAQKKSCVVVDLPSPDSVSSDSSITNATSRTKPVTYQDQVTQFPVSGTARLDSNPVDPNSRSHFQPVQEAGYLLQSQFDQQQQFIQHGTHFIHHQPTGALPVSAYYPAYPPQQAFHHSHQLEQPYPIYYMPARQPQTHANLPVQQSNVPEATSINPSSLPLMAAPAATPPVVKTEIGSSVYGPSSAAAPALIQVPTMQNQYRTGYMQGFPHIHHQSHSVPPSSTALNYAYEFVNPRNAQIYYTQPLGPSQYQPVATSAAVMPETTSAQLPPDTIKQLMKTSHHQ